MTDVEERGNLGRMLAENGYSGVFVTDTTIEDYEPPAGMVQDAPEYLIAFVPMHDPGFLRYERGPK